MRAGPQAFFDFFAIGFFAKFGAAFFGLFTVVFVVAFFAVFFFTIAITSEASRSR